MPIHGSNGVKMKPVKDENDEHVGEWWMFNEADPSDTWIITDTVIDLTHPETL